MCEFQPSVDPGPCDPPAMAKARRVRARASEGRHWKCLYAPARLRPRAGSRVDSTGIALDGPCARRVVWGPCARALGARGARVVMGRFASASTAVEPEEARRR